ncbi:MAG: DNA repair protein RecO [Alphaproteobacteria bacterium]|nr:DNA repair protein RecO [Alphaproteobacteria bacterium]
MPDWQDNGFVLGVRRFGENGAVLSVLTSNHGRHLGLIRRRSLPLIGGFADLKWRARLSEHLGTFTCEITNPFSASFMDDKRRLSAISTLCALLDETLPEREPVNEFYGLVCDFLEHLNDENWRENYVRLEVALLSTLGFGLDLSKCAAGGSDDLAYVSPKTGRAVSREKAEPYREKLLPLPAFLIKEEPASDLDIRNGLNLTSYFLSQHVKSMPIMRSYI